jgi:hypothetical protein
MTDILRRALGPTIEIVVEFEGGPMTIRTGANHLELALLNIALNARDAMPDGNHLQLVVRHENVKAGGVRSLNAGEYVCIAVMDMGIGMDEATLRRATEPFFTIKEWERAPDWVYSWFYGVAAQSQGAPCPASQVGVGTTVELYFPVAESGAAEPPPPASLDIAVASRSCNVLLVDDDVSVADTAASMLECLGHQVLRAILGPRRLMSSRGNQGSIS